MRAMLNGVVFEIIEAKKENGCLFLKTASCKYFKIPLSDRLIKEALEMLADTGKLVGDWIF